MWRALASFVLLGGGIAVGHLLATKGRKTIQEIKEGDLIQWESRGAFVFPSPRYVSRVMSDEKGCYVFVEGSSTGIPIEQVVLIKSES